MKTMINIKTDKEVKENAQKLAKELGLSLSAIVNASLKQFIRTREVYFSASHTMTPYLEGIVAEAMQDYEKGKNVSEPMSTAKDVMKHLND